jgi:hypothetical protein
MTSKYPLYQSLEHIQPRHSPYYNGDNSILYGPSVRSEQDFLIWVGVKMVDLFVVQNTITMVLKATEVPV